MKPNDATIGDVVQIDPAKNEPFGGCLAVVGDVYAWGMTVSIQIPGPGGGIAFLRVPWENAERIGLARWITAPMNNEVRDEQTH